MDHVRYLLTRAQLWLAFRLLRIAANIYPSLLPAILQVAYDEPEMASFIRLNKEKMRRVRVF